MKLKIYHDDHKTATAIKIAEKHISEVEAVRKMASDILGTEVASLTGEVEMYSYLELPDYPKATRTASANLLGIAKEYRSYVEALTRLKGLKRFQVDESNHVVVAPSYKSTIEDENTEYLEGEAVVVYKALQKVAKEMQRCNSLLNGPLAHQLIWVKNSGECGVNYQTFKRTAMPNFK